MISWIDSVIRVGYSGRGKFSYMLPACLAIRYEHWLAREAIHVNVYLPYYTDNNFYNSRTCSLQHEVFGFSAHKT